MPYDQSMATRIRALLAGTAGLSEKKMFGGIGWMVNGRMAAGAHSDGRLMIRCDKADWDRWCHDDGVNPMVQSGRAMAGWLLIDGAAAQADADLQRWVERGRAYAGALPPK